MNRRFPLFVDLSGKKVLIYGGGTVAARRCRALADFGPELTVIAPEISPEIQALPGVRRRLEVFSEDGMPEAGYVLAATDDPALNRTIAAAGRERGALVNDASDPEDCDFHFPALALRGPLTAGVNAGGEDHKLVARAAASIRELLKTIL